jgi:hypothetical protein
MGKERDEYVVESNARVFSWNEGCKAVAAQAVLRFPDASAMSIAVHDLWQKQELDVLS